MLMHQFEYAAPTRLDDALKLLRRYGPEARVLAGGTDLLVAARERGLKPTCLVDIKRIDGLANIGIDSAGTLTLGALTTVRDIELSPLIRERYPVLASAAGMLASVQVRNRATVGGNICNASPAADMAPPLLVLDARATASGPGGERNVALAEFFVAPGRTLLDGEVLTRLSVPSMPPRARAIYLKHGPRSAMDIAIVGVAVLAVTDARRDTWEEVRIAVASVAPTPIRVPAAERALRGATIEPEAIERAAEIAAAEARPISDVRGSADYRRAIVRSLTRRALEEVSS